MAASLSRLGNEYYLERDARKATGPTGSVASRSVAGTEALERRREKIKGDIYCRNQCSFRSR